MDPCKYFRNLFYSSLFLCVLVVLLNQCKPGDPFRQFLGTNENRNFSLLVRDANVVDGQGTDAFLADILIRDDEIAFIGKVDTQKITVNQIIEAAGRMATPGFIDPHAHGDPISHSFENYLAMGVTTVLLGQDGYTPESNDPETADISEWLDKLDHHPLEINIAMLAGHASLRRNANISDTLAPGENQQKQMIRLLDEALESGCFGISTGIEYVPGLYADSTELAALARRVGQQKGVMMSHVRNEDDDAVMESIRELAKLGQYCRVHVSHLKSVFGKGRERGIEIRQYLEKTQNGFAAMTADVYPYLASYTGIGIVFPVWAKTRDQFEEARKNRQFELRAYLEDRILQRNGPEATLFGTGPYAGKYLSEVEKETGKSFVDILMELGPGRASGAFFIMDRDLQDVFIMDPDIAISSDGSPTMHHPRGYGTYARMIETYVVREYKIPIVIAIKKMTSVPASIIGIKDRGILLPGYKADIVIFDPYEVKEKATYSDPHQFAEGFDLVIVNGKIAREEGKLITKSAGKVLRKKN